MNARRKPVWRASAQATGGTALVRRELEFGLPEAECRAADPRFALVDEA